MTTLDTTALICNTTGYVVADTARRAFTSSGKGGVVIDGLDNGASKNRPRFEMKNVITGALTELSWQYGGAAFTAGLMGAAEADAARFGVTPNTPFLPAQTTNQVMMGRTLYWTALGYVVERAQGGRINLLGALINGFAGPMVGDRLVAWKGAA